MNFTNMYFSQNVTFVSIQQVQQIQYVAGSSRQVNLYSELDRLNTFANWTNTNVDRQKLAMLGFYFTKAPDCVTCVFCGVTIWQWLATDDELTEHLKHSPNCPLLNLRAINNVPLNPAKLNSTLLNSSSFANFGYVDSRQGAQNSNLALEHYNPRSNNYPQPSSSRSSKSSRSSQYDHKTHHKSYREHYDVFVISDSDSSESESDSSECYGWSYDDDFLDLETFKYLQFEEKSKKHTKTVEKARPEKPINKSSKSYQKSSSSKDSYKSYDYPTVSNPRHGSSSSTASSASKSSNKACKICYGRDYNVAFVSCGHVVACKSCASSVKKCPICRECIKSVTRLYFS